MIMITSLNLISTFIFRYILIQLGLMFFAVITSFYGSVTNVS